MACQYLKTEEHLINIKAKHILVNGLSESMSAMLRHVTYLILKGLAWAVHSVLTHL